MQNKLCVHILTLPHRQEDRLNDAIKELQQQGVSNYEVCYGIIETLPFKGIARAYKKIIKSAKDKGLPMCCIMEDDCRFSDIGAVDYFIENIPESFDIYLGSIYWGDINEDNTVKDFSGFTFCIIHSRFYDTFLSTNEENNIDRNMKPHCGKYIVCNPYICEQIDGYSDNAKLVTKYHDTYMVGKKFFKQPICP